MSIDNLTASEFRAAREDGLRIEYYHPTRGWIATTRDEPHTGFEYRIKPEQPPVVKEPEASHKAHKHAEVIKAWADGAEIEGRDPRLPIPVWETVLFPRWYENWEYRVKPPREFPKTRLSGAHLRSIFLEHNRSRDNLGRTGEGRVWEAHKAVANEAIKQYILDTENKA